MKHFISPPLDMSSTLMSLLLPSIIFSTLLISLQCTTAFSSSPTTIDVEHDAHALLALKNGFQFPEPTLSTWNNHSSNSSASFLDDACSSWIGVRCLDGRVISLDLTDFNLRGSVSPAIYALDSLIHLSLAGNNLTGNIQLSDLSASLRFLNISNNQFNGSLEWKKGSDSTGGVVFPDLEVFDAYDNNFTDLLPVNGLLELRKLKHLDLGGNYFYGEIPAEYGMLSDRLEYLSLQGNDLRGRIPSELGNLTSLKELYLGYYNSWEGGIPAELGNLVNLVLLDISNCELLDGTLPPQLGNLSLLKSLYLHANLLSGPIPKEFGNLTGLINLDLSNNALTGEIPSELSSLKQLKLFNLFMNKLHGSIPDYVAREFPDLEVLQLWKNNFTGMIPQDLGKNSGKLESVDLSSNKLTGTIPSGLCDSKRLNVLILLRNFLFGPIPDGLGTCFSLVRVRLGQNYLNGSIPSGLIYLPQLNLLELQDNDLTGSLAENPTSVYYNDGATAATSVHKLVQLDLSNNHLSGPLPSSISNLSSLQFLLLGGNQFSGPIPSSSLGKLEQAVKIDLSKNNISGRLPSAFEACTHLTYLDLSQNNLSGTIPPQISSLRILNYLNLSRNHLEGGIPDAIGSMKSLTNADFSFNNLSGELPETGQLSVFNASSFAGNSQLCGSLINNPCNLSTLMPDSSGGGSNGAGKAGNAGEFRLIFAVGFLICSLVFTAVAVAKAKSFKKGGPGSGSWKMTTFGKVEFRVSDVLECMRDGNVIGRGGAGIVYRGKLPNGMEIAVKKLLSCGPSPSSSHDDHGFRAEIQTLGNIRHRNIVRLLAFCSNKQTNVLVFEYMRNGSLGEALHNGKLLNKGGFFLGWNLRYKIAIEAAKGLCYLHHDCSPLIVHRDVKSNNILLDSNFEAHVADFGLAKFLVDGGASECMSAIAGSYGYIAPEYAYTLRVDEKSDVYSFGVVLLELLTGHRPVGDFGEGVDIVQWSKSATRCRKEEVYSVIDQRLIAHAPQDEAMHFFFIAMLCVQDNSVERPTMRDVVQMLTEFQDHRHQHHKVQDPDHLQSPSSSAVMNQKSNCSRKEEKEQRSTKPNSRDHLLV